jgi:hypothetical protein
MISAASSNILTQLGEIGLGLGKKKLDIKSVLASMVAAGINAKLNDIMPHGQDIHLTEITSIIRNNTISMLTENAIMGGRFDIEVLAMQTLNSITNYTLTNLLSSDEMQIQHESPKRALQQTPIQAHTGLHRPTPLNLEDYHRSIANAYGIGGNNPTLSDILIEQDPILVADILSEHNDAPHVAASKQHPIRTQTVRPLTRSQIALAEDYFGYDPTGFDLSSKTTKQLVKGMNQVTNLTKPSARNPSVAQNSATLFAGRAKPTVVTMNSSFISEGIGQSIYDRKTNKIINTNSPALAGYVLTKQTDRWEGGAVYYNPVTGQQSVAIHDDSVDTFTPELGMPGLDFLAAKSLYSAGKIGIRLFKGTKTLENSRIIAASHIRNARNILTDAGLSPAERNQIIKSFDAETFRVERVLDPRQEYRLFDDNVAELRGRYVSPYFLENQTDRITRFALPKNSATRLGVVEIPKGSIIFTGRVASQVDLAPGLIGGETQTFLLGPLNKYTFEEILMPRNTVRMGYSNGY